MPIMINGKNSKNMLYQTSTLLDGVPFVKKQAIILSDWLYLIKCKVYHLKNKFHHTGTDRNQLIWLDPKSIQSASKVEFNVFLYQGRVVGGDWDDPSPCIEASNIYQGLKQRFIKGMDWKDTLYYKHRLGVVYGKRELDIKCQQLDDLFASISSGGYKTQRELNSKLYNIDDEIAVNIGRDGQLLLNNGWHRICIAKLIGLERIPVKVTVQHPGWVNKETRPHNNSNLGIILGNGLNKARLQFIGLPGIAKGYIMRLLSLFM